MADAERQRMDVDIVCVGFGPATAGFLTTLARRLNHPDGTPRFESRAVPGMPLQVICYERAEGLGFGVSGVVTRARGLRASFPDLDPASIPLAAPVTGERLLYLLDPHGASRRGFILGAADLALRATRWVNPWYEERALKIPWIPGFLAKHDGLVLSIGQFLQWAGERIMATGAVQIWPNMPVAEPLVEGDRVAGVRLADQGVDRKGNPEAGYLPGMDIRAGLTVVGDGPYGPVGRALDARFGHPEGHAPREWAIGMKAVVDLPADSTLAPGTVFHTFGYPEPEIFGFLYVYPGRVASLGVFIPSWFGNPVRTAYRYLQHWMLHPYLWRYLKGGTLRSWGAKSLQESGRRAEPVLAGDGFARIGEGSGSTNILANSGVDEAWTTGVLLADGVLELLESRQPFTRENLARAYVARRRASWVDAEAQIAEGARDGFHHGLVAGLIGTSLAAYTNGVLSIPAASVPPHARVAAPADYFRGRIPAEDWDRIARDGETKKLPLHDAVMDRLGWPPIPMDGKLLISHQDVLLVGGKVQAPAGYADHVVIVAPELCAACAARVCIECCSGQAIMPGEGGVPAFDREKCVHCGGCVWNCSQARPDDPERGNLEFRAGAGGLHSTEN
jgi:electron-transferring-flavoprotein dehydrogenase